MYTKLFTNCKSPIKKDRKRKKKKREKKERRQVGEAKKKPLFLVAGPLEGGGGEGLSGRATNKETF